MKQRLFNFNFICLALLTLLFFVNCSGTKKISKKNVKKQAKTSQKAKASVHPQNKTKLDKIMVYLGDESVIKWKLISINNQKATELFTDSPMMRFDDFWKQIYGTTGCNKFTAYYLRDNNIIGISRVSLTELSCDNSNESLFINTLSTATEVNEEGNTLSILANGKTVLVFEKL
ncbi:META domain-containing protein [Apibacter sp. HY039]|uniref:META domain-containing protein n=1 Tax=Apibacter sp. HY039 TaxID=2501476 RepID=UPI000FEBC232|nr:META domain-containing protein [Apibacter sp. HY039]